MQEHVSSCMYQKSHCNRCKQFVILNEHEDYCPEMPVPCSLCSKVMKRKRLKVSMVFSPILFMLFPMKSLCLNFCQIFGSCKRNMFQQKKKMGKIKLMVKVLLRKSNFGPMVGLKFSLFLNSSRIICVKIFHQCYGCCFVLS